MNGLEHCLHRSARCAGALVAGALLSANAAAQSTARAWLPFPSLPVPVRSAAAATDGDRVYVLGGWSPDGRTTSVQVLDLESRSWSAGPPLPVATDWGSAAWVGGELHFLGGVTDAASSTTQHWVWKPGSDGWSPSVALPTPLAGIATVTIGPRIYLFAGNSGSRPAHTSETHVFDTETGAWTRGLGVPGARINWSGTAVDGRAYLIGGGLPGLETSDEVLVYDPSANSWTALPSLDEPLEAHAVASVGRLVCVAGGRRAASGNFSQPRADVVCFDHQAGRRVRAPRMPAARQEIVAVAVPEGMMVIGGAAPDRRPTGDVHLLRVGS